MSSAKGFLRRLARQVGVGPIPQPAAASSSTTGVGTFINPGSSVTQSSLGSHSYVGPRVQVSRSKIGDRVRLEADIVVGDSEIQSQVTLQSGVQLWGSRIGSFSYIGRRALCGPVQTGKFCSIGPHVVAACGDHPTHWISTAPVFFSPGAQCGTTFCDHATFDELRPTQIGHDVWIGAGAVIRNGLTLGHGAIIGAQAVVTSDVPPYAIVGGLPARLLRLRFPAEFIDRLTAVAWWDFPPELLRAEAARWRNDDVAGFLAWAEPVRREIDANA
jgi:acetyltransferase-like isoleucine patch superfamily enzyme